MTELDEVLARLEALDWKLDQTVERVAKRMTEAILEGFYGEEKPRKGKSLHLVP